MKRNRKQLYLARDFRIGRLIKDGEAEGGQTAPNNTGGGGQGNFEPGGNTGSESNNTSGDFDPASFWESSGQEGGSAPSGESAGSTATSDSDTGGANLQTALTQRLESLAFGDPVMTEEIAQQINNGDFSGFQERINQSLNQAVRHALSMNVQILRPFADQIMSQVREEIGQTLSGRDDHSSLITDFPAAKNPVLAKTIEPIFAQALKNTKGDRAAAVKQTKEMLRFMSGAAAEDLDLEVAPRGSGDRGPRNQTTNWLDELTTR